MGSFSVATAFDLFHTLAEQLTCISTFCSIFKLEDPIAVTGLDLQITSAQCRMNFRVRQLRSSDEKHLQVRPAGGLIRNRIVFLFNRIDRKVEGLNNLLQRT